MKSLRGAIAAAVLCIVATAYSPELSKKQYVYICDSRGAVAYHINPDCRGLEHCKHSIFKTTKDSAINYYGKRACKICCN